jgi:hypothetical protein
VSSQRDYGDFEPIQPLLMNDTSVPGDENIEAFLGSTEEQSIF